MAIARSRRQVTTYVPRCDQELPPDRQTRFRLRPLTAEQLLNIEGQGHELDVAGKTARPLVGTQAVLLVWAALVGWENFGDESGRLVEFAAEDGVRRRAGIEVDSPASAESLEWLGVDLLQELAREVYRQNKVSRDDVGK